jgi:hypothetical protein
VKKARVELDQLLSTYGVEARENPESKRYTMRGFKIANAELSENIQEAMKRVVALEKKRAATPRRVPVQAVTAGEVIKLRYEAKHISDLFKMVAYQAESDLVRLIAPHYRRSEDEARTSVSTILQSTGDLEVTDSELRVLLEPLSAPHRTQALIALCDTLNDMKTVFPGTALRLHFEVKPEGPKTLAFPGARPTA